MELIPLNLPPAKLNLTRKDGKIYVWCILRKKKLVLTPEEWVRQHLIHYFINHKGIPQGLIVAEYSISYNQLSRRCDLLVFDLNGKPLILVECKAPDVLINEKVLHQIAQYNFSLNLDKMILSNGLNHFNCEIDRTTNQLTFDDHIPEWSEMKTE